MRDSPESTRTPASEDVLSLFEPEQAVSGSTSDSRPVSTSAAVEMRGPIVLPDVSVEGPDFSAATDATGEPGAISLERLVEIVAPLRFVEGVAIVQALGAALKSKAGMNAGMPDGKGMFLTGDGEFVVLGQPTGEPATRELARLLHRLVPSEATPPVGRLFVDRWSSGSSADLTEFSSELAYFARPNGSDLLKTIHARCSGGAAQTAVAAVPQVSPTAFAPAVQPAAEPEPPVARDVPRVSWLQSHRHHMVAASALIAATVVVTGLATWFWPSPAAEAAQPSTELATSELTAPIATDGESDAPAATMPAARDIRLRPAARSTRAAPARPAAPPPAESPHAAAGGPIAAATLFSAPDIRPAASLPSLPSRGLPDMRIYSASDSGIEPPKLRSTELVEGLIAGFDTRTNQVEVIVSQSGDVERVRMLGPPQRIPDVMLLSRVKEWAFDPATKDGAAVRYRLILSWNVTP